MIYAIRHGETDANSNGDILRGNYFDDELNAKGHEQAKAVAKQLKDIKFDVCYCSPLKRTIQTCEPVYSGKIILDKRLLPRDYGELIKLGETPQYLDKNGYWNRELNLLVKNGESVLQLETRIKDFLDDIIVKHPKQNVLVVTHGSIVGTINAMLNNFSCGAEYRSYKLGNCEIIKIPN